MANIDHSTKNYPTNLKASSLAGFIQERDGTFYAESALSAQQIIEAGRWLVVEQFRKRNSHTMTSPHKVRAYLSARLEGHEQEVFLVMFLDNKHSVITDEIMFYGTIDAASVYPREVVKRALQHNAAALILAHNHPSGNPEPSQSDIHITQRLKDALALVDVRVLDHIVIGAGKSCSLAERGHV